MITEDRFVTRLKAAEFVCGLGLKISHRTLAKYASIGGGPLMVHFGRNVFYREPDLLDWVEARLSKPRRSTSEPRK